MNAILLLLFYIVFPFCQPFAQANVGIGTTNPAFKLDVHGSINTDSVYRIKGLPVISSPGYGNLFIGPNTGEQTVPIDGFSNTFVGAVAGQQNTVGARNTFTGKGTGNKNTYGNDNSFYGHLAGYFNVSGDANTFLGTLAGYHSGNANENTFVGVAAGNAVGGTGSNNTAVGARSATSGRIGTENTFVGYEADVNNPNLLFDVNNSTAVGAGTKITAGNQMRFGNADVTSIGGMVGWSHLSDGRFKANVKENVRGLAFVKKLRPVTYTVDWSKLDPYLNIRASSLRNTSAKTVESKTVCTGFIAQEVEQAAKELGFEFSGVDVPKNSGDTYGLRYAEFTVPLVKAVQELAKEAEELKKEITAIKERLNRKQ